MAERWSRRVTETSNALDLDSGVFSWNEIARVASAAQGLDDTDEARLFALLNMAGADAIIAGFEAKYVFGFWRPVTAIRAADTDGNPNTIADPSWMPLAVTPAHPDYPSNHSLYSGAAAHVLERVFHSDRFEFSITSTSAPGAMRSFHSFTGAAEECGSSRVWIGYHFRTAVEDGLREGEAIGKWSSHALRAR